MRSNNLAHAREFNFDLLNCRKMAETVQPEMHVDQLNGGTVETLQTELPVEDKPIDVEADPETQIDGQPPDSASILEAVALSSSPAEKKQLPADSEKASSRTPSLGVAESNKGAPAKQTPRRSFTTEFKLECVEHAERTKNKTETARIFNVNRRRVQEWCMQKEKLMSIPKQQKRLSGGGRRLLTPKTDDGALTPEVSVEEDRNTTNKPTPPESTPSVEQVISPPAAPSIPPAPPAQSMENVVTDPSVIESIIRGLSSADPSVLPPNMVKLIQDLSAEISSQEAIKSSVEALIRDTSMEVLLQKGASSISNQTPQSQPDDTMDLDVTSQAPTGAAPTDAVEEPIPVMEDTFQGDTTVNTQQQQQQQQQHPQFDQRESAMDTMTEGESASQNGPLVQDSTLDISAQAALLDALVQVATSQGRGVEAAQALGTPAITSTDKQSSEGIDSNSQTALLDALMQVATSQAGGVEAAQALGTPAITSTGQQSSEGTNSNSQSLLGANNQEVPMTSDQASNIAEHIPARSRTKKFYTVDFKLDCVAHAEMTSKCAAARQFNVDRRRVQDWCSQKEKLQQMKWVPDKKPMDFEVEKQLAAWVHEQQEEGKQLTRKMVGDKAVKIYRDKGNNAFNATVGWVAKFMIRNGISLVSPSLSRTQLTDTVPEQPVGVVTTSGDNF